MDDAARTPRSPLTMDAMRPSQAFGAPPAPSLYDPWTLMRLVFRTVRDRGPWGTAATTSRGGRSPK